MSTDATDAARLRRWQGVTLGTLLVGYAGYYVGRSVLPVVSNQLVGDPALGFTDRDYGRLVALGIFLYGLGKLPNGILTEYLGGRTMFLAGMLLSTACVVAFGLAGGSAAFFAIWGANRFVQSMGWGGLVQTASRWFAPGSLATVMGVLSLSYLFGDALARLYLGAFAKAGLGWRDVFLIAAGTLGVIAVAAFFTLRRSPADVGLLEPPPAPGNLHGDTPSDTPLSLRRLLAPLVASRAFWLVCAMNVGLTAIRETFNSWTPRYLKEAVGLADADAGLFSFVFPLCGAVSCLAAGYAADRVRGRCGRIVAPLIAAAVLAIGLFAVLDLRDRPVLALGLIGAIALLAMGPYTFCAGVLAIRLGGQRAAATSAGIIDALGYLGSAVTVFAIGELVEEIGFATLPAILFGIAVATLMACLAYWATER